MVWLEGFPKKAGETKTKQHKTSDLPLKDAAPAERKLRARATVQLWDQSR